MVVRFSWGCMDRPGRAVYRSNPWSSNNRSIRSQSSGGYVGVTPGFTK